jgi:hypothetical protein
MVLIRLETEDGRFVGNVEVLPFPEAPKGVVWGQRFFILHQATPEAIYREAFFAFSLTSGDRCMELSQTQG